MSNTIDILGDEQTAALLISREITEFVDDTLTDIGSYAFSNCSALTSVSLPAATSIGYSAFSNCSALTSVSLPAATSIGYSAFSSCTRLTSVSLPLATSIDIKAFSNCYDLTSVILGNTEQVATISSTNVFNGSSNAIIYVPDALVNDYKATTNWSTYANRIKGISELPA